jgi:hypothetical protein
MLPLFLCPHHCLLYIKVARLVVFMSWSSMKSKKFLYGIQHVHSLSIEFLLLFFFFFSFSGDRLIDTIHPSARFDPKVR